MSDMLSKIRELAALTVAGKTHALRAIHADHLRRAVTVARRQGSDETEIERLITAAQWAERARTHKIARSAAIMPADAP